MMKKNFKLSADQIKDLIESEMGCIATDMITVDGELVDYMYRSALVDKVDSGWKFFSGKEDQDYIDNLDNSSVFALNTIANYDPTIIPYLDCPVGTRLERNRGTDIFFIIPE